MFVFEKRRCSHRIYRELRNIAPLAIMTLYLLRQGEPRAKPGSSGATWTCACRGLRKV